MGDSMIAISQKYDYTIHACDRNIIVDDVWEVVMRCRHPTRRLSWPTLTGLMVVTFVMVVNSLTSKM